MLVVSRKIGRKDLNTIWLELPDGQKVRFTMLETRDGWVRVGVDAPAEVRILRGEIHDILDERKRVG